MDGVINGSKRVVRGLVLVALSAGEAWLTTCYPASLAFKPFTLSTFPHFEYLGTAGKCWSGKSTMIKGSRPTTLPTPSERANSRNAALCY